MKNTDQTWNPTELLYLFVDGEADDLQKATLFAALANDAELQSELADAIRINAAARQEQNQTAPPAAVTAALFERAGIAGPIAAASLPEAEKPPRRRRGAAILPLAGLRRIAAPLLAGCLGALIAIALLPERTMIEEGRTVAIDERAVDGAARRADGGMPGIASPAAGADAETTTPSDATDLTARSERSVESTQSRRHDAGGSASKRTAAGRTAARSPHASNGAAIAVADDSPEQSASLSATAPSQVVDRRVMLRAIPIAITPLIEARKRGPNNASPESLRPMAAHRRANYSADRPISSLAVQMQAIAAVDLFPQSSVERADNTPHENLSFMGLYHLSDNHSIGGVFGRENHAIAFADVPSNGGSDMPIIDNADDETNPDFEAVPDITNNGNGTGSVVATPTRTSKNDNGTTDDLVSDRLQTTTEWVGVSYQFRAGALDRRGTIRPFAQAVVGGTFAGDPLGKATIGLLWKPSRRVSVGAGIEGSALIFRQEGEWGSSRKIGATYGVQIEF